MIGVNDSKEASLLKHIVIYVLVLTLNQVWIYSTAHNSANLCEPINDDIIF